MPGTFHKTGLGRMLDVLIDDRKSWVAHLFVNDVLPDENSVISQFVEGTWQGYFPVSLLTWSGYTLQAGNVALSVTDEKVFYVFEPGPYDQLIRGYYITQGGVYRAGERFPGPGYPMDFSSKRFHVIFKMTLANGFDPTTATLGAQARVSRPRRPQPPEGRNDR